MNKTTHRIYIGTMVTITICVTIYLAYTGYSYYELPLEERFYHPRYDWFKPAGTLGHGLGILGTLMILFGVSFYIARKRYNFLARFIRLKYLLEFHIFLCFLGSILVVFHTSFKFGGLVSIAFWSMVAVVLSGIIGRMIYIQIPRTIEGRELSLQEVQLMREELVTEIDQMESDNRQLQKLLEEARQLRSTNLFHVIKTRYLLYRIKHEVHQLHLGKERSHNLIGSINSEIALSQRIGRLQSMQQLFKYWHVAHMPFALIMLVIVLIHVIVTLALGYKWIF